MWFVVKYFYHDTPHKVRQDPFTDFICHYGASFIMPADVFLSSMFMTKINILVQKINKKELMKK